MSNVVKLDTSVKVAQLESGDVLLLDSDGKCLIGVTFQAELLDWEREEKLDMALRMFKTIGVELGS